MDTTDPAVTLERVVERSAPTLANLFQLYAYDFSEQLPLRLEASGRFEVGPADIWWTRGDHFAYLIQAHGELAGFAMVRAGSRITSAPDVMDMAEFFVVRGKRGKGIGRVAAHAIFTAFPGTWEVRVRRTNNAALQFWSSVAECTVGRPVPSSPFCVDSVDWDLLGFVTA